MNECSRNYPLCLQVTKNYLSLVTDCINNLRTVYILQTSETAVIITRSLVITETILN